MVRGFAVCDAVVLKQLLEETIGSALLGQGGDSFAFQVLDGLDRRVFRDAEHPTDRSAADLGKQQLADLDDVGPGLQHPVVAGNSGIEDTLLDVPGHLLSADQQAFNFTIINRRVVGTRREGNLVAGAAKQLRRRLLKAAGRDPQFQNIFSHSLTNQPFLYTSAGSKTRWPKSRLVELSGNPAFGYSSGVSAWAIPWRQRSRS